MREGPYASAVLRFEVSFPDQYPAIGPTINFSTEIFHPLLVPLTSYTFAAGALDPNTTVSSSEAERLPPGSFNLRYEFPQRYPSEKESRAAESSSSSSEPLPNKVEAATHRSTAAEETDNDTQGLLLEILQYVKKAFEDASFLDGLPLSASVNTNAWHAWRDHRGLPKLGSRSTSPVSADSGRIPQSPGRNPGEWNWDGVWESRVRNGIEESISDVSLFGSKNVRANPSTSGPIRFTKMDDERTQDIQDAMLRAMGMVTT